MDRYKTFKEIESCDINLLVDLIKELQGIVETHGDKVTVDIISYEDGYQAPLLEFNRPLTEDELEEELEEERVRVEEQKARSTNARREEYERLKKEFGDE